MLQFIKNQDKLYREEQAGKGVDNSSVRMFAKAVYRDSDLKLRECSRKPKLACDHKSRFLRTSKSI